MTLPITFSGVCKCKENFYGTHCGFNRRLPPFIVGIEEPGLCNDLGLQCDEASVLGYGFVDISTLVCKLTSFKVHTMYYINHCIHFFNSLVICYNYVCLTVFLC